MARASIAESDLEGMGFDGRAIVPTSTDFDERRKVWNAAVDRHPAVILECASARDVVTAIRFAQERNLPVSVRGGGHSVAGLAVDDGAAMIDLSAMRGISVDPEARTITTEGGALWGDVDRAASKYRLACPGGHVSTVGVCGLALGGGIGWLHRKHGLSCDNIVKAEVVTADGSTVVASPSENADLFWALRGGGGNFGVVTGITFHLHPVHMVLGGMLLFPHSRAEEVIEAFDALMERAPDELTTGLMLTTAPPGIPLPEELRGDLIVGVIAVYAGDMDAGERVVQPLRELKPALDFLQPMPYLVIQGLFDAGYASGNHVYWKTGVLDSLDKPYDDLIESQAYATVLISMGGATTHVLEDETAFCHRDARYSLTAIGLTPDSQCMDEHVTRVRTTWDRLGRRANGAFLNFLGQDEARAGADLVYDQAKLQRLADIKRVYDPHNVFRLNTNIAPA